MVGGSKRRNDRYDEVVVVVVDQSPEKFRTRLIVPLPVISVSEHLCRSMRESCGNCTHDTASVSGRLWQAQCSLADLFFSRSKCPYLNIPSGLFDNTVPAKAKIKPAYWLPKSWKKCDANSGVKAPRVFFVRRWPSIALARVRSASVRGVATSALEDEADVKSDQHKTNDLTKPGQVCAFSETVDQQIDRQPHYPKNGAIQSALRSNFGALIRVEVLVLCSLKVMRGPTEMLCRVTASPWMPSIHLQPIAWSMKLPQMSAAIISKIATKLNIGIGQPQSRNSYISPNAPFCPLEA